MKATPTSELLETMWLLGSIPGQKNIDVERSEAFDVGNEAVAFTPEF